MNLRPESSPARDEPSRAHSLAGHIPCVICTHTIALEQYRDARCWTDPNGITCAAHAACLLAVGEQEIGLR